MIWIFAPSSSSPSATSTFFTFTEVVLLVNFTAAPVLSGVAMILPAPSSFSVTVMVWTVSSYMMVASLSFTSLMVYWIGLFATSSSV